MNLYRCCIISCIIGILVLLSCGCAAQSPAPKAETGYPAAESGKAEPGPNPQQPKAGHWEGTGPAVSFDVTEAGEIVNFRLSAPFVNSNCVITLGQVSVADNKFLVDAKTADEATASIGIFVIDGQFNGESATGTHKVEMCGRTVSLQPQARPWRAGWVGAVGALPPTPTPFVAAAATGTPTATLAPAAIAPTSGVYLAEYKPVTYSLGYGTYSVGTFMFSSEDPADNIHKGDPITFYGVEYPHAIFGHAPSRFVFDLGEASGFSELSATIGLVQHINCGDGVTFIVLGDDAEIFRSEVFHAWTPPTEIRVAIQGVRKLSLRADEGPLDDWYCDWAIWGDPLLH